MSERVEIVFAGDAGSLNKASSTAAKGLAGLENAAKAASKHLESLASGMASVGRKMTVGITLPIVAAGGALIKMASDAVESENLFEVSMGSMAGQARAFSEELRAQFGLNAYEVRKTTGVFNNFLSSMGLGKEAAYGMATGLTQLSYDMGSFFNLKPEEMFQRLQSAMAGEIEPMRRLGVDISETKVEAYALAQGLIKAGDEMSQAQKAAIRYGVILEQTTNAQGDLARTADSPANAMRRAWDNFQQQLIDIGMKGLPAVAAGLSYINDQALPALRNVLANAEKSWNSMTERGQIGVLGLAGLMVAGGPLMTAIAGATRAIVGIGSAFNFAITKAAMLAGAAVSVGAAFEATMYSMTYGLDKFGDRFKSNMGAIGNELLGNAQKLGAMLTGDEALIRSSERMYELKRMLHDLEKDIDYARNTNAHRYQTLLQHRTLLEMELKQLEGQMGGQMFNAAAEGAGDLTEQLLHALGVSKDLMATIRGVNEAKQFTQTARGGIFEREPGQIRKVTQAQTELGKSTFDLDRYNQNLRNTWSTLPGPIESATEKTAKAAEETLRAAFSASELAGALSSLHPATAAVAEQVATWQSRIASVNLALVANSDQLKAAQADLSRMSEHLSSLNSQLSEAKQRLSDLSAPKLTGQTQLENQIAAVQKQIERVSLAKLQGVGLDQIVTQFPILRQGMEAFVATLPTDEEGLRKFLDILTKTKDLQFGEQLQLIGEAARGAAQELTFDQAIQGITQTRQQISDLTSAVQGQEAAMRGQQQAIAGIQAASEALNRTLADYQNQLKAAEANQNLVTQALQMAFQWFVDDRQKVRELGGEAVAVADTMDKKTTALLAAITKAAADTTGTSQATLAAMVAAYQRDMLTATIEVGKLQGSLDAIPTEITTLHTTIHRDIFESVGGGGPVVPELGGAKGGWFKVPGFAQGGAFAVGGLPGIDSVGVAFRAKPGEVVSIQQPGQQSGVVIHMYNPSFTSEREFEDMVLKAREKAERRGRW